MSHTPHELAADFPEYAEKIQKLKETDAHFARLADAYHEINRQVHRSETNVEPVSDDEAEAQRVQRVRLKDEIYAILTK